jgi:uncharacterized coiled-coil protein SlyX
MSLMILKQEKAINKLFLKVIQNHNEIESSEENLTKLIENSNQTDSKFYDRTPNTRKNLHKEIYFEFDFQEVDL